MSDLYTRIERLCKERKINITTMCKESGASRGSLSDLKFGRKQSLSVETLTKIASYFGISVAALLGEQEAKKEQPIETDELSSEKQKMYDIIDNLSAEPIRRLIQIACAAFDEQTN